MNSYLLRNLSGITSASIEKYLLFTGWVRDDTFNSTRMWVFKSKSDPEFKIAVPASEKATDFYPQVYNLIQTLSVVDGKTEQHPSIMQKRLHRPFLHRKFLLWIIPISCSSMKYQSATRIVH